MINITKNEEEYYNLPRVGTRSDKHHVPLNQAYKAGLYLPDEFYANQICQTLKQRWGINTHIKQIGHALRKLTTKKLLTRHKIQGTYKYKKTTLYERLKQ